MGVALLAEFLEEFFLAERIGAVQQTEQQIFRFVRCLAAAVVLIVGSGECPGCDEQLGLRSRTVSKEADEIPDLIALFRGARRELDTHAEFGMHHSNHAFGLDFHVFGFQTEDDAGVLREWRFGFDVAATQAEIGKLALGNGLGILRKKFRRVGDDPSFESFTEVLRQVDVANA